VSPLGGASERDVSGKAGKRESGKAGKHRGGWKEQGERVETHILPTPTTSTTSWLATLLPPRGRRVICEKHVDLREREGRSYSFISSYISCKRLSLLPRRRSPRARSLWKKRRPRRASSFIDTRDNAIPRSYTDRSLLRSRPPKFFGPKLVRSKSATFDRTLPRRESFKLVRNN